MKIIIILGILSALCLILIKSPKNQKHAPPTSEPDERPEEKSESLPIQGAYQKDWLFSHNEKDAYQKLRAIADELGYIIFAKVRLLDLLSPVKGITLQLRC